VNIPSLVKGQFNIDKLLSGDISDDQISIAVKRAVEQARIQYGYHPNHGAL